MKSLLAPIAAVALRTIRQAASAASLTALALVVPGTTAAQHTCGFDPWHAHRLAEDPDYAARVAAFDDLARNNTNLFTRSSTTYRIPIVVHVLEDGTPSTQITDEQIRAAVRGANERFRKVAGTVGDGDGVDTGIEFVLAVRDPDGNCTSGINRVNMRWNSQYMMHGVWLWPPAGQGPGLSDWTMMDILSWDRHQYMNVYVLNRLREGTTELDGYGTNAVDHGAPWDCVRIVARAMRDSSFVLAHEIGHNLNLYHTFTGDVGGACPPNADCTLQGDQVCDTPPHINSNFTSCSSFGPNTCDGGSSSELFRRNYMDYTVCANKFTAGQAARMVLALTSQRSSYLAENGNMSLVPPAQMAPLDILTDWRSCPAGTVELSVRPNCLPTTFLADSQFPGISYAWTVQSPTATYTSTAASPTITGVQPGLYTVSVVVTTPSGTFSRTEQGAVTINPYAATCQPTSVPGINAFGPKLTSVTTNRSSATYAWYNRYSADPAQPTYKDLRCSQQLYLTATDVCAVQYRTNSSTGYLRAYIDFNNNGTFEEPGELIADLQDNVGNSTYTVPPTAVQGVNLRMRIACDLTPITVQQMNCAAPFTFMDVVDESVIVGPLPEPAPWADVAVAPAPGIIGYGTPITFQAVPTNGGTSPTYAWFRNGMPAGTGTQLQINDLLPNELISVEMTSSLDPVRNSPARGTRRMNVVGAPIGAFDAYPRMICPGEAVTFIDRSLLSPTVWTWSFPGGTPSTSVAQYPTVTYNTPGTYPVTLTAANALGTGTPTTQFGFITVFAMPPAGCTTTRANPPANGIGIHRFKLGPLNLPSNWNDAVMVDRTCLNRVTLAPGTTYPIGVTVSGTHAQWVRVLMDVNRNGSFGDPGELIFSPPNGTGLRSGSFTTAANPPLGVPIRLRVISDVVGTSPGPCPTPLQYGQVEEYTVIFEQDDCQGTVNGTALPGTPCNDQQACTLYDVWDVNCDCVGVPIADNDADGICNPFDPCVNGPNPGTPCNDGNPCTANDVVQAGCGCAGTPLLDTDGDGLCNAQDNCPNVPGQVGSPCDDGNPNTPNDVVSATCLCAGVLPNDNTCNAVLLGVGVNGPFSNAGATAQQGEPQPPLGNCTGQGSWCTSGGPANNSVWFSFVAPPSGRVSLGFGNTATWDSRIALWSATSCSSLLSGGGTLLAANDDLTGAFPYHAGIAPLCVTPGQTYYVQVDGWGTVTNSAFELVLMEEAPAVDASVVGYPAEACPGYQALFTITGTPGAQVTYSLDWGQPITAPLTNGTYSFYTGGLSAPATVALFSVTDGTCPRQFDAQSDQAVVQLATIPVIGAVTADPPSLCAGNVAQLDVAMESGASYCNTGLYTMGCLQGDMITAVQFADLSRTSGCDGGGAGYSLIGTHQAHVQAGQAYAFSMTTGSAAPQGGAAWVDWDQDGEFEGDEILVAGYLGSTGAVYSNPSCLVPPTARNGRTRMRVRAIHGSNPGTLTCAAWDHGEVEDYYVHVSGGQGTYTYNWTAGTAVAAPTQASTASLPLAQDGLFLVSVMNEQGCFATGSVQVTVQRPPQVIGLVTSDTSVCAGSDVQLQLAVAPSVISCQPGQLYGECATDEHIAHVSFGSIANPSGCSLPGGYEDQTAKATTVAAGATGLTGSVTIAQAFPGDQVGVWFDWDQDGDLTDAGEAATVSGGPANWTFSVNVPANARDGATRMRVRLTYQATPQPCGTSNYGETEDYSVIVTVGTQPVGYVWSPIDALNSNIVPNPQVNDLEFTTNYTVTVTGPTGCSSQAGITLLVDGDDADGDGMGDCTDPCPAIAGGPGSSCDDGDATTLNDVIGANCTCTGTPAALLQVRMVLEGPYASATGLMNDALRTLPDFPLTEPYTALGYAFTGGGGETIAPGVLLVSGPNAIVDWVVIELRDRLTPSDVVASRAALLQRDGDVVDLDGTSPVAMAVEPNGYLLAVRHRNHLGVMAADPVPLFGDPMDVDLSIAGTTVHGTAARKDINGAQALWAGDVTFNDQLKYAGAGNDRDPILVRIGGNVPTATASGYHQEDCTLDGLVKYAGAGNDRDVILINVGGSIPTAIRQGQLP